MIDTHTHLFDEQFADDLADAVARAQSAGVSNFILPAIDSQSHQSLINTATHYPCCFMAMGLHPTSVNDNPAWREELAVVRNYLYKSSLHFVAVGEVGLDLYWSRDFLAQQVEALQTQVEWAVERDLPLILHIRDAWNEIFEALEPYKNKICGVFHSFSGSISDYERTQQLGDFYVGIGGVVTFKKSALPELIAQIPLERIITETDSPYLAPVPHRGKRNESGYLPLIVEKIAAIKGVSVEEVDRQTTLNAKQLFGI